MFSHGKQNRVASPAETEIRAPAGFLGNMVQVLSVTMPGFLAAYHSAESIRRIASNARADYSSVRS